MKGIELEDSVTGLKSLHGRCRTAVVPTLCVVTEDRAKIREQVWASLTFTLIEVKERKPL